jgi:Zn-dependent peptidase ImmA (M78 family)
MNKYVKICGLPYKIIYREDNMSSDYCGVIDHKKQIITINQEMAKEYKEQTIIHEMVHGMLVCIGRNDLSNDEVFVQSLANAVYTSSLSVVMEEKRESEGKK